jgi:hypothetical protein
MTKRQPDLFGDAAPRASARDLKIVRQSNRPLSKQQQTFNRLLGEAQRLKDALAEWRACEEKHLQRLAGELEPLAQTALRSRRALIQVVVDAVEGRHEGGTPRKAERRKLISALLDVSEAYFRDVADPDPELVAIYDRYSQSPYAKLRQEDARAIRDEVRELFGFDIPEGLDLDDLDDIGAFLEAAFASSEDEAPVDRAPQAADASSKVRQTLREIYRKLASALHPDRASGAQDHDQRTELMGRVNDAYERADLLALLELQLEIEQIDEDHLWQVSQSRLEQFNGLLRAQVATLKGDIASITDRFRMAMMTQPRKLTPEAVEGDFERALQALRNDIEQIGTWVREFPAPDFRRAWLDEWEKERREAMHVHMLLDEELTVDQALLREAAMMAEPGFKPRRRPNARRKKRR